MSNKRNRPEAGAAQPTKRERAIEEARRRAEAATDPRDRIYWRLIGRMIETDSALEHFGHVVDERGVAWSYCISVKGMFSEAIGDLLPRMRIERIHGSMETLIRYEKARNQVTEFDGEQKDFMTDRICEAVLLQE